MHSYVIFLYIGNIFGVMKNQLAVQKAKKETERFKAEAHKLKPEVKPEYVPNEATIKELFSVQQVATTWNAKL